jgi:hypothetical protein
VRLRGSLVRSIAVLALAASVAPAWAQAPPPPAARRLPFLGHLARDRGIELPLPFGTGVVYYYLSRDIAVEDVRVGRDGAPVSSVSDYAQLASVADVDNVNVKFDVWLLPFVNVYAIAGYIWNESETTLDISLPALRDGQPPRTRRVTVPTAMTGTVGGLGITLAGGYGPFFMALDSNGARADLGFDDRFHALVTSARVGWHGKAGGRPLRVWANATYWDTFATATGTVDDPEGGTLSFEVDQGPAHPWTYGLGAQVSPRRWLDLAVDVGTDFKGGFYVALVPVVRF